MGIEDLTLDDVLEELRPVLDVFDPLPGDFTLYDVCEKFSLSREAARNKVANLVKAGKVVDVGKLKNRTYYRLVR